MTETAQHLLDCAWCKDETEQFARFLATADDQPPEGIAAGIRRLFARPVMRTGGLVLRGDARGVRSYVAGDVTVTLDQQDPSPGERGWVIAGLVQRSGGAVNAGSVRLQAGPAEIAATNIDSLGNFFLAGLEAGIFRIELLLEDMVVDIEGVEVSA
jgi:hypothetical protein